LAGFSPTVRRRRLGLELRQLREAARLTLDDVGEKLEWSGAKVSRIENARVRVTPRDVRDLLEVYGVTDEARQKNLILLTREARERAWWEDYREAVAAEARAYVGVEEEALALHAFDVHIANGLLQTEEYARAVLRGVLIFATAEEVERAVRLRMGRQKVLHKEDHPLQLWSVIDESVLRRRVGGPQILRGQLRRLVESAELPNVTLQVLPLAAGAHAGIDGGFMIAEFRSPDPDVVYIEYRTGGVYLEDEDDVGQYNRVFNRLQAKAMDPDESVQMIAQIVAEQ
jgi:transcriptional regulator with XRE-family HTH domain